MNMQNTKKYIKEIILIAIGTLIMSVAIAFFLLPNKLSSGGFVGIATIIYYFYKIPVGTVTLVLNIPLFIVAFIKLGKGFFFKTIIGTLLLSFFIDFLDKYKPVTQDRLLACIYGGILMGFGLALVFKANGSTGGADLLTNILNKYNPKYRMSDVIVIIDGIIILLNVICFRQIEIGLYSAIVIYLSGQIIDFVFEGLYFGKLVYIISNKNKEISDKIITDIERGITGLNGKGMYKDNDKLVLMCVVSRRQLISVRQIAKAIDPEAFIIITNAREVFGKGFKQK